MAILRQGFILSLSLFAALSFTSAQQLPPSQQGSTQAQPSTGEQLMALANEARRAQGAPPLQWDPALAAAALNHCKRMAAEGEISHRYGDEPSLTDRAGQAGAHFSLIEENVAVASYLALIHQGWMQSPTHRTNLLNPQVDHVGIATVTTRGVIYAVADYSRAVQVLTQTQVEAAIAGLLRASRVSVLPDPTPARAACALDRGLSGTPSGPQPQFVMRWQGADLTHLPPDLVSRLASGRYHQVAVGNCATKDLEGSFTAYRLAVLLY
jgi:uncharacterized protein YkwD